MICQARELGGGDVEARLEAGRIGRHIERLKGGLERRDPLVCRWPLLAQLLTPGLALAGEEAAGPAALDLKLMDELVDRDRKAGQGTSVTCVVDDSQLLGGGCGGEEPAAQDGQGD